jgi:hypothetical protein
MGRVVTPKYAVEIEVSGPYRVTPAAWRGRPTSLRLAQYVEQFERSTQPGGANAHLGPTTVTSARVKQNFQGGAVVATYYRHATLEAWARGAA